MEFSPPPACPKCGQPCDEASMEAVVAPGVKTLYLTTWKCSRHDTDKKETKK